MPFAYAAASADVSVGDLGTPPAQHGGGHGGRALPITDQALPDQAGQGRVRSQLNERRDVAPLQAADPFHEPDGVPEVAGPVVRAA